METRIPSPTPIIRRPNHDIEEKARLRVQVAELKRRVRELEEEAGYCGSIPTRNVQNKVTEDHEERDTGKKKLEALKRLIEGQAEILQRQAQHNTEIKVLLRQEQRKRQVLEDQLQNTQIDQRLGELEILLQAKDQRVAQLEREKEQLSKKLSLLDELSERQKHDKAALQSALEKAVDARAQSENRLAALEEQFFALQATNETLRREISWDNRGGVFQVSSPRKTLQRSLSATTNNKLKRQSVFQTIPAEPAYGEDEFGLEERELLDVNDLVPNSRFEIEQKDGTEDVDFGSWKGLQRSQSASPPVPALLPKTDSNTKLFFPQPTLG